MRTLLVFATVLAGSSFASAQSESNEFQFTSTNSYNALVERVSALEQEKSKGKSGTAAGLTAGADVVFLRPFGTDNGMPNHDYQAAPRVWVGWQGDSDLGLRLRWFDYYQENPTSRSNDAIDAVQFDVELTSNLMLGDWTADLSGGFRYAELTEISLDDEGQADYYDGKRGMGPVVGMELARGLTDDLGVFMLGRSSIQFGDAEDDDSSPYNNDQVFAITEIQMGIEWHRPLFGTALTFMRAGVESQFYHQVADGDEEALGLFGGVFSFGIQH